MAYVKKRTTGVINRVFKYKVHCPRPEVVAALETALTTQCYLYNDGITYTQKAYDARADALAAYEADLLKLGNVVDPGLAGDLVRLLEESREALAKAEIAVAGPRGAAETFEKRRQSAAARLQRRITEIVLWQAYAERIGEELPPKVAEILRGLRVALWKRDHPLPTEFDLKKVLITERRRAGHPYLLAANQGTCQATVHRLALAQAAQFRRYEAGEQIGDLHYKRAPRKGNAGSPGVWNCLEYNSYDNGNKFRSGTHEVRCHACSGNGYLFVYLRPCPACPDYCARHGKGAPHCPKCHGVGIYREIPAALRKIIGMAGLVDPAGTRYMQKKITGTQGTMTPGRHDCPLCEGVGTRSTSWAKVALSGIGELRLVDYRPLPEGTALRNMSILREVDGWWVCLIAEIPFERPAHNEGPTVGLDFGLRDFITASDGNRWAVIGHRKYAEAAIIAKHQARDNKVKGSAKRRALVRRLRRAELHVKNARRTWQRNVAKQIAVTYGLVKYEKLAVKKLTKRPAPIPEGDTFPGDIGTYATNGAAAKSRSNKLFADAAPAAFVPILESACERFGSIAMPVAPDTRTHADCGHTLAADGSCPHCGPLKISRQLNSAKNAARAAV